MNRLFTTVLSAIFFIATVGILPANEPASKNFFPETYRSRVWSGFGILNARAGELVYGPGGTSNKISHLVWDVNNAVTYNLGYDGQINDRWSLYGEATVNITSGDSNMADYDYLIPGLPWSHRSLHSDTNLNHYFQFDTGLDFMAFATEKVEVHTKVGFRYTDISMDAYGGNFVYSTVGFRDSVGRFPANELGISYRQKLPGIYFAPQIQWEPTPNLNFKIGGLIGTTFNSEARDHHWQRGLLFVDNLNRTAFYGAMFGIDYRVAQNATLYLEGSYDKYKRTEGYTDISSTRFGTFSTGPDTAGADLTTTQIKAGVRIEGNKKPLFPGKTKSGGIFR